MSPPWTWPREFHWLGLSPEENPKWLNILDTLADIPFIVPTAVLGYSLLLFWSRPEGVSALFGGALISPGWLLVALLHFTFSYPIVVRVIVGALLDYKIEYEQASRTLGAPPITTARTVTFAIIKPSLIAAFILAFARSISETGATMMVAGAFENGPVFIQNMKNAFSAQPPLVSQAEYEGATVFASIILIAVSCLIFAAVRVLGTRLKLPFKRAWPTTERKFSYSKAALTRNSLALLIFLIIVLTPSLFVALPAFEAPFHGYFAKSFNRRGSMGRILGKHCPVIFSWSCCNHFKCFSGFTHWLLLLQEKGLEPPHQY